MRTGEKLTLKRQIANQLSGEDFRTVDVTLAEFSLPTNANAWQNDHYESPFQYVLEMLQLAPDYVLEELAEHVGVKPAVQGDLSFWKTGAFRLFISHLARHKDFAKDLQSKLDPFNFHSFVAHADIKPSLDWRDQIEAALHTCHALVALLHPGFHKSPWTDQELGFALGRRIPVLAIDLGIKPYGLIGRYQAFSGGAANLLDQIFNSLQQDPRTKIQVNSALVEQLVGSSSYDETRRNMTMLQNNLSAWDPSFASRLRSAVNHNGQVRETDGVSDSIDYLIRKWENTRMEDTGTHGEFPF
jgi:hypothetical protein